MRIHVSARPRRRKAVVKPVIAITAMINILPPGETVGSGSAID